MSASGKRRELSLQLATQFAGLCAEYLDVVEEAVQRTDQVVSFSARVSVWRTEEGVIRGRLSSSPPRIPARKRDPIDFVLAIDSGGQLELVFEEAPRQTEEGET